MKVDSNLPFPYVASILFWYCKNLEDSWQIIHALSFFFETFWNEQRQNYHKKLSYIIVYYRNYWRPSYSFLSSVGSKNRCNVNFKFDQCCVDIPLRRPSVQWTIYMGVWRNTFSTSLLSEKSYNYILLRSLILPLLWCFSPFWLNKKRLSGKKTTQFSNLSL